MKGLVLALVIPAALLVLSACSKPEFDVVIRGGTLYDGSGAPPVVADLAIDGDRIVVLGDLAGHVGRVEVDATGLAVAPGFINMLSWANESLIQDGRSLERHSPRGDPGGHG